MPGEGTILKFKDYQRSERVPFEIYADVECLTKKIQRVKQTLKNVIPKNTKNMN